MAVSIVIIACALIGILSSQVSSQPTKRLIHLKAKQRPQFPPSNSRDQAFSRLNSDRKSDKNRPAIKCSWNSCDTKKTSVMYHLPKPLQLHDAFDIIIKARNHAKSLSITLMTENQKSACSLIIKPDNEQSESEQSKGESKVVSDEGQPLMIMNLDEFLLQDSSIKVNFTVRKNQQTGETTALAIGGGYNNYIDAIEIHENIKMGDITFLKLVGNDLEVAELKFVFDLPKH